MSMSTLDAAMTATNLLVFWFVLCAALPWIGPQLFD